MKFRSCSADPVWAHTMTGPGGFRTARVAPPLPAFPPRQGFTQEFLPWLSDFTQSEKFPRPNKCRDYRISGRDRIEQRQRTSLIPQAVEKHGTGALEKKRQAPSCGFHRLRVVRLQIESDPRRPTSQRARCDVQVENGRRSRYRAVTSKAEGLVAAVGPIFDSCSFSLTVSGFKRRKGFP